MAVAEHSVAPSPYPGRNSRRARNWVGAVKRASSLSLAKSGLLVTVRAVEDASDA